MTANPYYPVTSDSSQLAEDEWGLTMPSVQYSKYSNSRTKSLKAACKDVATLSRCTLIIFVSVLGLILISVLIAVAAGGGGGSQQDDPTTHEALRRQKMMGLNFFPVPEDKTTLIRFKMHKFKNDEAIKKSMDDVLKPYGHTTQTSKDHKYCSIKDNPADKICMFPLAQFGTECTESRDYGYGVNLPCVLIQLDLPVNITMEPITEGSPLWEVAEKIGAVQDHVNDPSKIPLSCGGVSKEDRDMFNPDKVEPVPSDKKFIRYWPENAFPSYFYRQRNMTMDFVKPAVMLQFTSLLDLRITHIKCTAYGQLYENTGRMVDHPLLETHFAIYIEK